MFRVFTARIKAMFDEIRYPILENKCFVFLQRACKAMFDKYVILY